MAKYVGFNGLRGAGMMLPRVYASTLSASTSSFSARDLGPTYHHGRRFEYTRRVKWPRTRDIQVVIIAGIIDAVLKWHDGRFGDGGRVMGAFEMCNTICMSSLGALRVLCTVILAHYGGRARNMRNHEMKCTIYCMLCGDEFGRSQSSGTRL